jgi:hypothetical protein
VRTKVSKASSPICSTTRLRSAFATSREMRTAVSAPAGVSAAG